MLLSEVGSIPTFTEIIYGLCRTVSFYSKEEASSYIKGLDVVDPFYIASSHNIPKKEKDTKRAISGQG